VRRRLRLGRVDGFGPYQPASKADDGCVADIGLVATKGDAFEALELADRLFDAGSEFVETLRKEAASVLGVLAAGNDRCDPTCTRGGTVCPAVVSFVGDGDARLDVRADVERGLELGAVADFASGQVEVERAAVEIGLEVDFGGKAAARAAQCLMLLPPFAPAAETWARAVVLSKNCTRCAVSLHSASS